MQDGLLDELNQQINQQLAQNKLKVEKAQTAIVDATIIQTAGDKLKKAIEVSEHTEQTENQEQTKIQVSDTPASKDTDAKWTIKSGHWHLGYKLHARTDAVGFIEQIHVTPANAVDVKHLASVLDHVEEGVTIYTDKGYDSKENRTFLEKHKLKDGIMRKAHPKQPLNRDDIERNKGLSKVRYRVEQSFAILHRLFKCKRASYFGLEKVKGQMVLKVMCLNLLKAANKLRLIAPIAA